MPGLQSFFALRVDANDIEDLVQDVALRLQLCTRAGALENGRAYLYQVARSVVTDHRRRHRTRQRDRHEPWRIGHEQIDECCPERVLKGKQELARAMSALHALPERTAHVFKLHRFEHVRYAAIAERLEISVSAVEKHISRATRHLQLALAP